jgi:hypothetical protein
MLLIPSATKKVYKLYLCIHICLDLRPKNHISLDFVYTWQLVHKQDVIHPLVIFLACDFIKVCSQNLIHSLRSSSIIDTLVIIEHNHLNFYSSLASYIY